MAVALLNANEDSLYSPSSLRRSHSQPKFNTQSYSQGPARSKSTHAFGLLLPPSGSATSSGASSPRTVQADSNPPSYASTPDSSCSLDTREEEGIAFDLYNQTEYFPPSPIEEVEDLEPPASPRTGDSYTVSPTSDSADASRPESPDIAEPHAEDDSAVSKLPSRHVDYLSHNWKEEDIWSSWRLIVSKRDKYSNSARLENASWRTWMKAKNKLKTVSPETLNWMKDCDVTWLYGPLQSGSDRALRVPSPSSSQFNSTRVTKNNSFVRNVKPILKKRSMSEIMLQKSLSSSSLLKQATAAVQAQQLEGPIRPGVLRTISDFPGLYSSRRLSRENHPSMLSSIATSGIETPSISHKHISFNDQVEQCIAIEVKGGDDDESERSQALYDDSDSDDGLTMKRSNSGRKLPPLYRPVTPSPTANADTKTIAMLPSTTLKYMTDSPGRQDSAMKHSSSFWNGSKLSPSPSQETLRPSKPSTRLVLGDNQDEDEDADMDWQPPGSFGNRKDSTAMIQDRLNGIPTSGSSSSLNGEPSGMRRTPSGMFMPYEEDEDEAVSEGLFGKVVDTVNTAKDIAHVIWNVGWRR